MTFNLRRELERLRSDWIENGLPSRETIVAAAQSLLRMQQDTAGMGLWISPPRMVSATLDDAIGQGIELINLFAELMGIETIYLGSLQAPEKIVSFCHNYRPRYLGVTVLQMDSEDDLAFIGRRLPPETRLIAGGPAFRYDTDMASRCGVHAILGNVARFIDFMLKEIESGLTETGF